MIMQGVGRSYYFEKHTKSLCRLHSHNTDAQKLGTPRGQSGPKVGSNVCASGFLARPRAPSDGAPTPRGWGGEGRGARSGSARAVSCAPPPPRIRSSSRRPRRRWWWWGGWHRTSPLRGRCRGPGRTRRSTRRWRSNCCGHRWHFSARYCRSTYTHRFRVLPGARTGGGRQPWH
jgi:hypothetical protein